MTAKLVTILGAGLMGIVGTSAAAIIHANTMKAQAAAADSTTTLTMDLIQAKAGLEGWQQEAGKGNMSSADYRTAFSDYLGGIAGNLSADAKTW